MPDPLAELIAQTSALVADKAVAPATKRYGAAVTAWAQDLERRLAPPAAGRAYAWNVRELHPLSDQSRAVRLATHLWANGLASFAAEGALVHAAVDTPLVDLTWHPSWTTPRVVPVPLPDGAKAGGSRDQHLTVLTADGSAWSMELCNPAAKSFSGLGIVHRGEVNEGAPAYDGSNAALLDMSQAISAVDVSDWNLKTLLLGTPIAARSGVPAVYPSPATWNDAGMPYGQLVRLDPAGVVPSYSSRFLAYVDACLRECGGVVRDQADALTVYGRDHVNDGGNAAVWAAVGASLTLPGISGYPIGCYLPGIPWSQLQALEPPPRIA